MQAHGFRYCFTPLSAVLFTFPSRYLCAIGLPGVFSLGGWCRRIRAGFHRPRPTQDTPGRRTRFRVRGCHPVPRAFPGLFRYRSAAREGVLQPRARLDARGLGCAAFAHHYSRHHCCFLFLPLLRCFSSGGSPPPRADAGPPARRVAPFGHPGVEAHSRLAPAFRSLSRPSSPPGAKASTVRPRILRVSERHHSPRPPLTAAARLALVLSLVYYL